MIENNKIAVVAYTNFNRDSRVQKEALAALELGYEIDIYSLVDGDNSSFNSFNFIRINIAQYRGNSKFKYIFSYFNFFSNCLIKLSFNFFNQKYKFIHFHNMPNFLVFSGLIPKLFGAKIILDIHDLMPELFSVKFNLKRNHPIIKMLYLEERLSAKFSNEIIATNDFHIKRFAENGFGYKRITEVINIADSKVFYAPEKKYFDNELIIAYPSTLSKRLGIDDLVDAIAILSKKKIAVKLYIYGDGDYRDELIEVIKNKNLSNLIYLSDSFLSLEELSEELNKAHLGIIPLPSNGSNDIAMPVKIYEFFAKKICVIASDLPLISHCFTESVVLYRAGDVKDLAAKIEYLYNNRNVLADFSEKGFKQFSNESWSKYKANYQNIFTNY